MINLSGKIALVTGASRGIGEEIAIELSKSGASVIINYSKDDEGALKVISKIEALGGYAIAIKKDISKAKNCKELIEDIIKKFGKIDILINNAGKSKISLLIDTKEEEIESLINTNLNSTIYLSKYAVEDMIKRGEGNIINISSVWGQSGASCESVYSATKGGINLFTKALAKEVIPFGIRVNAVAPGVINTEMNNVLSSEEKELLNDEIPAGRFGEVNEVAKTVLFLCDDNCKYIVGEIININGAMI